MAFEFVKNVTGILAQTQDKINRQFLKRIEALESKVDGNDTDISKLEEDVAGLKTAIGSETTKDSILYRIKALEDAE